MKVVGFTFVRNCVKFDYPFLESIRSLLPLCDEVIVIAGKSEDQTLEQIKALDSPKLKLYETIWDESLREGGRILAQQTNIALDRVKGDWAIYLQADEVLHEQDYPEIQSGMERYKDINDVEGLLFRYKHFYGSYDYIGDSRRWYRQEIRIIKPIKGIRSWGDAQGFRINERKLRVKAIDATIYHYGWVKPPVLQQLKQRNFNKFWHSDGWVEQKVGTKQEYDYSQGGKLKLFDGSHPVVMKERIHKQNWQFFYDQTKVRYTLKEKILDMIEKKTGSRIGEYKNYKLI
jgi:glycosyltransferase involved in cell wall biosynthesis